MLYCPKSISGVDATGYVGSGVAVGVGTGASIALLGVTGMFRHIQLVSSW